MVAMASKGSAVLTLPTPTQIHVTREFDAPRHLVFMAWTTPELIKRWWAGERGHVTVAEVDLRVGGRWRHVLVANGEFEVGFHGEYQEIVRDEKLVYTEIFEGATEAGHTVNTVTLEERDGRTWVTVVTECPNQEVRDMIIATGMEGGMQEALDHLEQVAVSLP
jgi:uncharacterized protein YndB with AHSA1/START domain